MKFEGFSPETSAFLWELMFPNERPWFHARKEEFDRVLKLPFDALAQETLALLRQRFPERDFHLHISRIYRDARRLYGHGPYKDHLWFTLWDGATRQDSPAFWFELGAAQYGYGVGFWAMNAEQMERYRRAFTADRGTVERLVRGIAAQERFQLYGEEYKRPKGDVGAELNAWYNRKNIGLECSRDFGEALFSAGLPTVLADGFSFLMPYYDFFCRFREGGVR